MSDDDRIRSALVDNLFLLYPQGPPADETQIRTWLSQIVQNEAVAMTSPDGYEVAIAQAVAEWKTKAAENNQQKIDNPINSQQKTKKQPASFSLFSQLDSSMFAPRMALEDFQAVTTAEERLPLFEKVANIDDLIFDWNEVLPLVQDGLNSDGATDYAKLHRKWFGQGRASMEHWNIRCDLCQNILTAIMNLVTSSRDSQSKDETTSDSFSASQQAVYSLWILWYEMWMDLMQQPLIHNENTIGSPTVTMGQQVLLLMRNLESSTGYSVPSFLALVDPLASWFQAWAARMTPPELLSVLVDTDILPDLWQRCDASKDAGMILTEQCQSQSQLLTVVPKHHALSMLRSILVTTRVLLFPASCIWENDEHSSLKPQSMLTIESLQDNFDTVAKHATDGTSEENSIGDLFLSKHAGSLTDDQIDQLFQLFFRVGCGLNSIVDKNSHALTLACAEAIEVLLYGARSRKESKDVFAEMLRQCRDLNKGSFAVFVSDGVVQRMG